MLATPKLIAVGQGVNISVLSPGCQQQSSMSATNQPSTDCGGVFERITFTKRRLTSLSYTRADRQGVDISVIVCNFVCLFFFVYTVTDFYGEDKASGVIFHSGSSASWTAFFVRSA